MTPERWRRIDSIFQEALERPHAERSAFLEEVCPDYDTRREIESLISFHEQSGSFLEVPALEATAALLCDGQVEEMIGLLVGPYRIEALLGAGGMGNVYLAEDTKLGRKVAIKFLPAYLETDEVAKRRLVKEARAAAKLDHPNICTIYEVVEDATRSFIVMQYVPGETLAAKIEKGPLSPRQSLEVALQIADALVEAHSHGIIHRDIKPQNIIITSRSQVKVLDFGLAKVLLSTGVNAQTPSQFSTPGMIVGTAPYMSPEQARAEPVDARSDLFSVGVVLYECITGKLPFSATTPMEVCALVITFDPPPPSHVRAIVSPEFDAVIMKALAKDPAARFESASELLETLRAGRALLESEAEPQASAASTAPMVRPATEPARGWRRARFLVLVSVMVLTIALLALWKFVPVGGATPYRPSSEALRWFNVGATALRNGTYYDASVALEKATADDDNFALGHARLGEAWIELGYADKANQEILRAKSGISDLSKLPRVEALYLQAITDTVLRRFSSAIKNYEAIIREAPDAEKAQAYVDLGRAYEKNNQIEKAIESYIKAKELAPSEVAAFLRLGIVYSEREQNLESAREAFDRAEELYQSLRNFEGVTEVCYQRGFHLFDQAKYSDARRQLEKAIDLARNTENHYQEIRALSVLSNVSVAEGNASEGKEQANQAIATARSRGINSQVASGLIWLGHVSLLIGKYADAERSYQEAIDIATRDKDSLNEAWALRCLGSLSCSQKKTSEAIGYLERARLFYEQGGYRKWLSFTLVLIGRVYRDQGNYEAAISVFEDLLHQGEQANDLSLIAQSHEEIGATLAVQHQFAEALSHHDKSYEIYRSLNSSFDVGYSAMHRGDALWQIGRYEEARASLDEASSIATYGNYNQLLAGVRGIEARLKLSQGSFLEAKETCRQALELAGVQYKSTAVQTKYTLGLAQIRSGASRSGMRLCEEAVDMATEIGDPELLRGAVLASAEALIEGGKPRLALEAALKAQKTSALSADHDSEWQAWLIAARARQSLGETSTAQEYARNAATLLASLDMKWGLENSKGYRSRPDIQSFINQLNQIL